MFSAIHVLILGSVVGVSALSFIGIAFFCVSERTIRRLLFSFVSVSTGVLFGDVFLHIIPELADRGVLRSGAPAILGGVLVSFCIEKFIHWHHCHILPSETHYHPVGVMNLVGDAIHNIVDGVLIAGSFLVDVRVGIATTLAVALHEIPHEISSFALLLFSGFTRTRALLWNALSGTTAILGAVFTIAATGTVEHLSEFLLAFAAGNLLYIAGTDLLPELHKDTHAGRAVLQLALISAGIGLMYALTFVI
ncbi:MAG: ZIP family metal transporter [Candidatus Peribacteraceae bacterium]